MGPKMGSKQKMCHQMEPKMGPNINGSPKWAPNRNGTPNGTQTKNGPERPRDQLGPNGPGSNWTRTAQGPIGPERLRWGDTAKNKKGVESPARPTWRGKMSIIVALSHSHSYRVLVACFCFVRQIVRRNGTGQVLDTTVGSNNTACALQEPT